MVQLQLASQPDIPHFNLKQRSTNELPELRAADEKATIDAIAPHLLPHKGLPKYSGHRASPKRCYCSLPQSLKHSPTPIHTKLVGSRVVNLVLGLLQCAPCGAIG